MENTAPGASCVTAIEKWLQEVDPEFSLYLQQKQQSQDTTVLSGTAATNSVAEAAARRRRKLKCPLQLHPQHVLILEAYTLLNEHEMVQNKLTSDGKHGDVIVQCVIVKCI